MPPRPCIRPYVIVVTGMAFEAGIAAGPGVVVVTGGAANTDVISAAVQRGCRGIISFGIAGGLTPDLKPGACIVARSIVTGDRKYHSHREWFDRLRSAIPGSIYADIAGAEAPVCSPGDKRKMAVATGAVAVDMDLRVQQSRRSNTNFHSRRCGSWQIQVIAACRQRLSASAI